MNRSFVRKVIYLSIMGLLLIPLSLLSNPETYDKLGAIENKGGKLAQERQKYGLSQARLGEIDPASETIKLACLGMRGVAANILWKKANDYQRTEDWTSLSATLEQITRLQPNFISVWRFQGWNLSYNVSVEWDDYRQRYNWVLKGVNFLRQGTGYNKLEPLLPNDMGWVVGHKMGTADEKKPYRVLFRHDDDYNAGRPQEQRDNWLVGKEYFQEAVDLVDKKGAHLKGSNPVIFFSGPAKWQTNYSAGLEVDGGDDGKAVFGERARISWDQAFREWEEFATRDMVSPFGQRMQMGTLDEKQKQLAESLAKLENVVTGLRDKLKADKVEKLPPEERDAYKKPAAERSEKERQLAASAEGKVAVSHEELAERTPVEKRKEAEALAAEVASMERLVRSTKTARDTIQFVYWKTRCEAERTKDCLSARELMYKGNQAYLVATNLEEARSLYEQSFAKWRLVLDKFPILIDDRVIQDDLAGPIYLPGAIRYYEAVLKKLDEKFPKDFILQDLLDKANPEVPIGK